MTKLAVDRRASKLGWQVRDWLSRGLRSHLPPQVIDLLDVDGLKSLHRKRNRLARIEAEAYAVSGCVSSNERLLKKINVVRSPLPVSKQRQILLDPDLDNYKTASGAAAYITLRFDAIRLEKAGQR